MNVGFFGCCCSLNGRMDFNNDVYLSGYEIDICYIKSQKIQYGSCKKPFLMYVELKRF